VSASSTSSSAVAAELPTFESCPIYNVPITRSDEAVRSLWEKANAAVSDRLPSPPDEAMSNATELELDQLFQRTIAAEEAWLSRRSKARQELAASARELQSRSDARDRFFAAVVWAWVALDVLEQLESSPVHKLLVHYHPGAADAYMRMLTPAVTPFVKSAIAGFAACGGFEDPLPESMRSCINVCARYHADLVSVLDGP
jgi:hypothetical protein